MAGTTHPSIKLLVVDDDENMRHDLLHLFRKQGHEVTAACSGEDALTRAGHAAFDIALLDLHLLGINGIDVLARLKELQLEIEVLMLTAHSSNETAVQAMKRGAYDYLTKPFRATDLEVHIQKAFEKVQLQRRDQPRSGRGDQEQPLPRGSVLPAECGVHPLTIAA